MKYKLMSLENKCITMERKMTAALRYQYKLIFSAWGTKRQAAAEDYKKVWFGFKRNLPANVLEEANTTGQLKGMVSEETRLSLLSFVDDVQYELKKMEEEEEEYRLNMPPLTDVETDAGGDEDEPE